MDLRNIASEACALSRSAATSNHHEAVLNNPGNLIPISDEQAKAAQEIAKHLAGLGRYLDRVLGRTPDDLVGYFGSDWLADRRLNNAERLRAHTEEIRRRRGTKEKADVSPSIALPLIQAAVDEDRDVLRDLWARLLAAALDPTRTHLVRVSLVELLKQLEPLDALILQMVAGAEPFLFGPGTGGLTDALAAKLRASRDETFVSLEHLFEIGCLTGSPGRPQETAKARLLVRAVTD